MFDSHKAVVELMPEVIGYACGTTDHEKLTGNMESALTHAFNAGLEAAAQTSEDLFDHRNESRRTAYLEGEFTIDHSNAGDSIASAIRALKLPEQKERL